MRAVESLVLSVNKQLYQNLIILQDLRVFPVKLFLLIPIPNTPPS